VSTTSVITAAPEVYTGQTLNEAPPWVEIDSFENFSIDQTTTTDGTARLERSSSPAQLVIVLNGSVSATSSQGRVTLNRRDWMQVPNEGLTLSVIRTDGPFQAELLTISGSWTDINVCTIFQYRPDRDLEMHFHDYNEYWFIFRGQFEGAFDGRTHTFAPGEILVVPAGAEHGTRRPLEGVIEGVGFSTSKIGRKRQGHLHRGPDGEPRCLINEDGTLIDGADNE
jgi:mannose-6-phosphate isomerase-like protein (cupin superfamily)